MKPTWADSLACLSSALSLKVLADFRVSLVGGVTYSTSLRLRAQSQHRVCRRRGDHFHIFLPKGFQSTVISTQQLLDCCTKDFNHVLNQLNWKSFSVKLSDAKSHVLYEVLKHGCIKPIKPELIMCPALCFTGKGEYDR